MSPFLKTSAPLLIALGLLGPPLVFVMLRQAEPPTPEQAPPPVPEAPMVSMLGAVPDWSELDAYQETISHSEFVRLLTTVFTTSDSWKDFIEITESVALIRTGNSTSSEIYELRFSPDVSSRTVPRKWKSTDQLPPAPAGKPLADLHIAIDPGHIGGRWARIEERWFVHDNGTPVQEGDMTLKVAMLLKPQLEALGAKVTLVRKTTEPVTRRRPQSLEALAAQSSADPNSPEALRKLAERLFYRTAEIRARARLVNETITPDLVLCLHFNADAWGDPAKPTLVKRSHFHVLLNGAYTSDEIRLADQRFAMFQKLLSGIHSEEAAVGKTVADVYANTTKLPAYRYHKGMANVVSVDGNPYLWARNLLANRLYDCPVIFMEPYVMNSTVDYPRIQAGDYKGLRKINGKSQPSIFREYADTLAKALKEHYQKNRPQRR